MIDVNRARAETPGVQHRVHFNNCGAALMPAPVIEALREHLALEARIGGYEAAEEAADRIQHTYEALARLLNCAPGEVAVVENATRGWDMVFYALPLGPGDVVLTSGVEYASNYIPYIQRARLTGAEIKVVPDTGPGELDVGRLEKMIDHRVKLISVTHVPTNSGLVNPAAGIGAVARRHGIPFLLDACQSVGQMPLDVAALNVDVLTATSRKFLRGPRGVGFIYVRKTWIDRLQPPFLDVHAATWTGPDAFEVRGDARRFENWECNVAAKIGLGVAADYAQQWGLAAIQDRVRALAETLRMKIATLPHMTVHDRGAVRCGIVSFSSDAEPAERIRDRLARRNINVSVSHAASTLLDMKQRGLTAVVRAGVHYYNTEQEIERCVEVLRNKPTNGD